MIRFEGVTKTYGQGTPAVDDLSLLAPEGQVTVLVGPSGCGKTTSLRMVNRMIEPTRGTITVRGEDTAQMDPVKLRRTIGYVIQHGGLFPHHTVERNVMTVPLLLGWDRAKARERARELLARVGLDDHLATRYPRQLSGGQQQRVGVARALAADPPVLLMDEPFSAVDPVVRDQLQDEMRALQSELRKTILFVTHDIDEAIRLGDQVAVLRVGGALAQVADPETLLARPADDFVADFVGRDRGYRSLGFRKGVVVPVRQEPTVALGSDVAPTRTGGASVTGHAGEGTGVADHGAAGRGDHWVLVVDEERRPKGWIDLLQTGGQVRADDLHLGGTLAAQDGSPRAYLDAALSSPSGRGVVVDTDGRLVGTVLAAEVIASLDHPAAGPSAAATP